MESAIRNIKKRGTYGIEIHDRIIPNESTQKTTWSMLTTTDIIMVSGNSIKLSQNGKSLRLLVENPAHPAIRIVPLNPPPLPHDMKIGGLKRIEIIQSGDVMAGECVEYGVTLNSPVARP